jgi:hypothetical protein
MLLVIIKAFAFLLVIGCLLLVITMNFLLGEKTEAAPECVWNDSEYGCYLSLADGETKMCSGTDHECPKFYRGVR